MASATLTAMLETGHTLGRYRVENQLGAGGMGEVYRAWDSVLQRWIALKVVPQGDKRAERLVGEARAAAALRHANIVSVYDVGETDGYAFVSMDLVEGRPLRDWIGDSTVKVDDKIAWLTQIASALRAAHKAGFVHRDMKPDNVMITTTGEARVLDFGLAKSFSVDVNAATAHPDAAQKAYLTVDGAVSGTPAYMAPEQLAGGPASPLWDEYAWGVLACELLTGKHPRIAGLVTVSGWVKVESMPNVPNAIAEIVARAMAPAPEQRFASMDEIATALGAPPSGTSSPYAVGATNPPAAPSVPSATMNVQIGDTLQVPVHPNAPAAQKRSRSGLVLGGVAVVLALSASVYAGWRLRPSPVAPAAPAPSETIARTADSTAATAPAIAIASASATAVASASAAPSVTVSELPHARPVAAAPRKLNVQMNALPSFQYDARTVDRTIAGLRIPVKACIEQHPPNTIPARMAVMLELWNVGDEIGKVRDVRTHEPPALRKCLYDVFEPVSFGPQKQSNLPPGAVSVFINVESD